MWYLLIGVYTEDLRATPPPTPPTPNPDFQANTEICWYTITSFGIINMPEAHLFPFVCYNVEGGGWGFMDTLYRYAVNYSF